MDRVDADLEPFSKLFKDLQGERIYPFVAIQADGDDIDAFATANAEELGRILTGDLEEERPIALRKYIEGDLSLRAYEKLMLRWTDALALYARIDDKKYEESLFRAVQVFEHCILAGTALQSLNEEMDRFTRRLLIVTPGKWFRSRDLLASFSSIEEAFLVHPRVQSVEADRLISQSHEKFGLDKQLAAAKATQTELREQLEWAKAQTLGSLALLTYFLDKIVGWDHVKGWVVQGVEHIIR